VESHSHPDFTLPLILSILLPYLQPACPKSQSPDLNGGFALCTPLNNAGMSLTLILPAEATAVTEDVTLLRVLLSYVTPLTAAFRQAPQAYLLHQMLHLLA
jgi:hypothetical protein